MTNKSIDLLLYIKLLALSVLVISRVNLLHLWNAINHAPYKKKILPCNTKLAQITPSLCISNDRPGKKLLPRFYNLVTAKVHISADQSSNHTLMPMNGTGP